MTSQPLLYTKRLRGSFWHFEGDLVAFAAAEGLDSGWSRRMQTIWIVDPKTEAVEALGSDEAAETVADAGTWSCMTMPAPMTATSLALPREGY
jgi:hypothetical protein